MKTGGHVYGYAVLMVKLGVVVFWQERESDENVYPMLMVKLGVVVFRNPGKQCDR